MFLGIDIGNTNIVMGVFKGKKLLKDWRIGTNRAGTGDEYGTIILDIFNYSGIDHKGLKGVALSSVVPSLQGEFAEAIKCYLKVDPLLVNSASVTGMPVLYDNPEEVGADRIVNAVGAYEKYKKEMIIVDFGTATTFDHVSKDGEYVGGAIAPGIMLSLEALSQNASMLPRIEFIKPKKVIGRNTISSMQSGTYFGYVSLIDGMVERIRTEIKGDPVVIATGGLAPLIASGTKTVDKVEKHLTLEGLRIIYERNLIHN